MAALTAGLPWMEVFVFSFLRRNTPEISVDELDEALRDRNARVLDVREDWEYRAGHVPGALHIPLGQLGRRFASLPRDKRVLVICASGNRSLGATDFLLAQGFEGVASVRGGTGAWARSGRPLDNASAQRPDGSGQRPDGSAGRPDGSARVA